MHGQPSIKITLMCYTYLDTNFVTALWVQENLCCISANVTTADVLNNSVYCIESVLVQNSKHVTVTSLTRCKYLQLIFIFD